MHRADLLNWLGPLFSLLLLMGACSYVADAHQKAEEAYDQAAEVPALEARVAALEERLGL